MSVVTEDILPGDIVAVRVQDFGIREGLVVDLSYDILARPIVHVRLDPDVIHLAPRTTVTRVRRTTYYLPPARRTTTIERKVYW